MDTSILAIIPYHIAEMEECYAGLFLNVNITVVLQHITNEASEQLCPELTFEVSKRLLPHIFPD